MHVHSVFFTEIAIGQLKQYILLAGVQTNGHRIIELLLNCKIAANSLYAIMEEEEIKSFY